MDIFYAGPLRWLRDYLNAHPRAEQFANFVVTPVEAITKKSMFGCQSCGQCLLHHNGLTCPMRCPKNLRNGPCGGVRANGHCEAYPERWCVWYLAVRRSAHMPIWKDSIYHRNRPVNWQLINSASWVNYITGRDVGIQPKWVTDKAKPAAKTADAKAPAKAPAPSGTDKPQPPVGG